MLLLWGPHVSGRSLRRSWISRTFLNASLVGPPRLRSVLRSVLTKVLDIQDLPKSMSGGAPTGPHVSGRSLRRSWISRTFLNASLVGPPRLQSVLRSVLTKVLDIQDLPKEELLIRKPNVVTTS